MDYTDAIVDLLLTICNGPCVPQPSPPPIEVQAPAPCEIRVDGLPQPCKELVNVSPLP